MTDTIPDRTITLHANELLATTFDIQSYAVAEQESWGAELMTFHVTNDLDCVINFYGVPKNPFTGGWSAGA